MSYHLDTEVEMTPRKNFVKAIVNKQNSLVLEYLQDIVWTKTNKMVISKVKVPSKIDTDILMRITGSEVEAKADLKVPAISPRHVKGHVTMNKNGEEAHVTSKVQWDLSRDPEKQISLAGTINMQDSEHKIMQYVYIQILNTFIYILSHHIFFHHKIIFSSLQR